MIEIKNLNKYFNKSKSNQIHVINDVSLSLPSSGMIAIFGKSGCGKTTLLNVIGGLDKFESGDVLIDGRSIKTKTDDIRNESIGYIFQNYNLDNNMTIFDNVATSLRLLGITNKEVIRERVMSALENVGLEKFALRKPQTVSGGQQQRVAIARAIVKGSDIILADEPTGNLDEENTYMVMDILKAISKDRLVLLVTHEEKLVNEYCDKIINIVDGKIVSSIDGTGEGSFDSTTRNKIYLGDYEKNEINVNGFNITIYGEPLSIEKSLVMVNDGKKVLFYSTDPDIKVLNESSGIKLVDGKKEDNLKHTTTDIDMSKLAHIEGKNVGNIFTFGRSFLDGYSTTIGKRTAGRKALIALLIIFAMAMVIITGITGANIKSLGMSVASDIVYIDVKSYYDSKGLEATQNAISDILAQDEVINGTFLKCTNNYIGGYDKETHGIIKLGSFNTANIDTLYGLDIAFFKKSLKSINENMIIMGRMADKDSYNEVVVSTALGDLISAQIGFSSSEGYENVIGMTLDATGYANYVDVVSNEDRKASTACKIVGIVVDSSPNAYYSDIALATQYLFGTDVLRVPAIPYSMFHVIEPDYAEPAEGEVIVSNNVMTTDYEHYNVGDSYQMKGLGSYGNFVVKAIYGNDEEYASWFAVCNDNDYIKLSRVFAENEYGYSWYYVMSLDVKSSNINKVKEYIQSKYQNIVISLPSEEYKTQIRSLIPKLAGFLAVAVVMCLCLFFIMKASTMSRVREIGIYRAIGVKKGNIIFKFFAESLCFITLTILIGFLVMSGIFWYMMSFGAVIYTKVYYPVWLGIALLIVLYGISTFVSILPVMTLMNKRPAAILAKYDI